VSGFFSPTHLHIEHDNDNMSLIPLEEEYAILPTFSGKIEEFEVIWGTLGIHVFYFLFEVILKEAQEKMDAYFA